MPSMKEIYQSYSSEYDELVNHEDYQGNLKSYLLENFDFKDRTVVELGVGTGRVSMMYLNKVKKAYLYDGSSHMLDKAKLNLKEFSSAAEYGVCDNFELQSIIPKADILIEGWSFGHAAADNPDNVEGAISGIIDHCFNILKPGGTIILIETLGTNSDKPVPPAKYFEEYFATLEKYQFQRAVIRTDYKFPSLKEARRIMGYFFGEGFAQGVELSEYGTVPEFTGIWHYRRR